jgi:hemolysin type calcium-binding protein
MTQTTQPAERSGLIARLPWHGLATRTAAAALVLSTSLAGLGGALPAYADFADGRSGRDVIIGKDNDNRNNPLIQLDGAADQSLSNTDIQLGGSGNDVMIGLLGDDVQRGESGDDVLIGGPEGGAGGGAPNSDVQFGDSGTDVSIWAPGDGSDFFHGGSGNRDAQVVGLIDRAEAGTRNVKLTPAAAYPAGLPSVDISGLNAQCTIDKVESSSGLGYDFLVRFRNAAGALVVTMRQVEVEQVFCPNLQQGIVYADLRQDNPQFRSVSLDEVKQLNQLVGWIVR